jgi:general L-amino acid transport system permease protein
MINALADECSRAMGRDYPNTGKGGADMATLTDPPREAFRLSQLIYDTRYRSMTIQVIAFILIMSGLVLAGEQHGPEPRRPGQGLQFRLPGESGRLRHQPAPDRVFQRLDPWPRRAGRHPQHAPRGLRRLHPGHDLGVTAGVLRLSSNWIVARLMSVYVEGFRNIPTLLWILIVFAVMTEATPAPRDFRGDDADATMMLFDTVAVTNRGVYTPAPVFGRQDRPPDRIFLASLVGIWAFRRYAKARQEATGDILPVFWISLASSSCPSIIFYFILGRPDHAGLPELAGFNFPAARICGTRSSR